ncbi:MAG: hypothetical protein COV46_08440 [Deltaproteobacteria bacterium CG11_big_fil_rev_8_21_14_0_20_49_13]|nr:MAG: hypothetical protein COV46_08440 [Deltaproteobacteria bacterium CG11_big_fil_rev_8_21_14_0_20_49_13]
MIRYPSKLKRVISLISVFIFSILISTGCGSSKSEQELVDADNDGIWDINDLYPNDTDNDGITNDMDADNDNDSCVDSVDAFPYDPRECADTDNDGIGNNADSDDDGDGILDVDDVFPLNKDEWSDTNSNGIGNNADTDDDGDGFPDAVDLFPEDPKKAGDHDGDGVDSLVDLDDDNDGYLDEVELQEGSNPLDAASIPLDGDADGLTDKQEIAFGSSPYTADTDGDGLGDKVEYFLGTNPNSIDSDADWYDDMVEVGNDLSNVPDHDNDGIIDALDYYLAFEFRPYEEIESEEHDRFGLSVANDVTIYIADFVDNAVRVFTKDGVPNGFLAYDELLHVNDITSFGDNELIVADTFNDRIIKLKISGEVEEIFEHQPDGSPGGFVSPRGVDVDNGGNIYVADTWNNRIQRYDALGKTWQALDGFLDPQDIAVSSDGIIAVADTGNFSVQLYNAAFDFVGTIDNSSLNLTPFDFKPRSVSFDQSGNLFIVDDASSRVVVVNKNYEFVRSFGSAGAGVAEFLSPTAVDIDKNGKVYVTDRSRVQVF